MRKSAVYLLLISLLLAIAALLALRSVSLRQEGRVRQEHERSLVSRWRLTDLALFTEARYTRHPSMADRNSAFQDYPFSFEHFPSGSLLLPPAVLRR